MVHEAQIAHLRAEVARLNEALRQAETVGAPPKAVSVPVQEPEPEMQTAPGTATAIDSLATEAICRSSQRCNDTALVDSAAGDVELAMLERKAALLREELEQLSSGQAAALTATTHEIDRSVAWVEEHLYRDAVASASHRKVRHHGDPAGARVCVVC